MPLISISKEGFDKEYDYYRVKKKDSARFNTLYNQLFKYAIIKKKPAPAKMLDEFLMLLDSVYYENKAVYEAKENEVISKVLEYFKAQSDYQFSVKVDNWITNRVDTEDFETLVKVVVIYLIREHWYKMDEQGKDDYDNPKSVMRDAYARIDDYLKGIKEYSHWQKVSLSGYITMCFGYFLFDTKRHKVNNDNINQYGHRFVDDLRTDKKKKPKK